MSKEYVIWSHKPGEEPVRIVKTEEELTQADYDLFLGDLLNTFEKCPPRTKIDFMMRLYRDDMGG